MDGRSKSYEELKRLFCEASELHGEEREAFLVRECGASGPALDQVRRLLAAHEDRGGRLTPPEDVPAAHDGLRGAPEVIGPFRITGVLGEGGMGIVYRAEQQRPQRTVALKVLRPGLASDEMLRRFEHEVEVLGRLHHPGIAQVFDAGSADVGGARLPYFVMELVEGLPVLEFAREANLSLRQRVELVAQVCDAMEHAHQQGIVHRDLKPGNILVDTAGQVKVLDFGIARAMDEGARETLLRTASGVVMGTLSYMSPEQARGGRQDVDARADVYSLGVVCFQVLTGALPYDFGGVSFHQAIRMIVESEPTRLGSARSDLRGDLETVLGKALEKEPARRYRTAGAFAEDLRRFLRNEPIVARPPSSVYQLKKFAQRNKALVSGIATTFLALVVGLIVSLSLYGEARDAREDAEDEARIARREADKAQSINEFILQDMLAAPNPWEERGDIPVSEVLDRAASRIDRRFEAEPLLAADVRATIGGSYMARGFFDEAEVQLAKALEVRQELYTEDHVELADSLLAYGTLRWNLDDGEVAERLCREAAGMYARLFGEGSGRVGDSLLILGRALVSQGRYDEARETLLECLALREALHDGDHQEVVEVVNELGSVEYHAQDFGRAVAYNERALDMVRRLRGPNSPYVGVCLNDLAESLLHHLPLERRGDALDLLREAADVLARSLGEDHPVAVRTNRNLGVALFAHGGDLEEAEERLRDAYQRSGRNLGRDHVDTLQSMNSLATYLLSHGTLEESGALLEDLVPRARRVLGPRHPDTLVPTLNLAWVRRKTDELDAAEELFREALAGFEEVYGPEAKRTVHARRDLLMLLIAKGALQEAEEVHAQLLQSRELLETEAFHRVYIDVAHAANMLGTEAIRAEQYGRAAEFLRESFSICELLWGLEDWRTADTRSKLGACLAAAGQAREAEEHLLGSFETFDALGPARAQLAGAARARLVEFYERQGDEESAELYR